MAFTNDSVVAAQEWTAHNILTRLLGDVPGIGAGAGHDVVVVVKFVIVYLVAAGTSQV